MKAVYYQKGETIDYVNAGETKIEAGTVVSLTNHVGIAAGDIAAGATGVLHLVGLYEFAKAAEKITLGQKVYFDESEDEVTGTAAGNIPVGFAVAEAAAADAKVKVIIGGVINEVTEAAVVAAVSVADAEAAAGEAPTKVEYDKLVALANANKAGINATLTALKNAGLMAEA